MRYIKKLLIILLAILAVVPVSSSACDDRKVYFNGDMIESANCRRDPIQEINDCQTNKTCVCKPCEKIDPNDSSSVDIDHDGDTWKIYINCIPEEEGCIPQEEDGTCPKCYTPTEESEGCLPIEDCKEDESATNEPCEKECEERKCEKEENVLDQHDDPVIDPETNQPRKKCLSWGACEAVADCKPRDAESTSGMTKYWRGDCGVGKFDSSITNDLWPSRTGCYNPEERFSYIDSTLDIPAPNPKTQAIVGVPRDDILVMNPLCVKKGSISGHDLREGDESKAETKIQCLNEDYSDDFDNFCGEYTAKQTAYNKERWFWNTEDSCWKKPESPAVYDVAEGDHWLPLALRTTDGISVSGTPQSSLYDKLGEYGFRTVKIFKKWIFDDKNIYNYSEAPTDEDISKIDNQGARAKKQECLKIYIEEYAHRGDCGEIVLPGARPEMNEGYCQWVAMYDNTDGYAMSMHTAAEAVTGRPVSGMRSEYYDYENFNSQGTMPINTAGFNVCKKGVAPGDSTALNAPGSGSLDFSKRGCPTVSGPDLWPEYFDMGSCDSEVGADRINDPLTIIFAEDSVTGGLTTDIDDIRSYYWHLKTGGVKGITIRSDAIIAPDDWFDYSLVGRSCHHSGVDPDYWNETQEYEITDGTGDQESFEVPEGSHSYDWEIDASQLAVQSQGAFWCEFELPYNPFREAGDTENRVFLSGTNSLNANIQHLEYNSHLLGGSKPSGQMKLQFKMIERIRDGCGAFSQRATWIQDPHWQFAEWLIGKKESRCAEWTGLFGKEYEDPRIVSWRLPRFNYEFLKAFIECTGPVQSTGPSPCGSISWYKIIRNIIPEEYGGCDCAENLDDYTQPDSNFYYDCDDCEGPNNESSCDCDDKPDYNEIELPEDDVQFGFWCKCPSDQFLTIECNENYCTCIQDAVIQYGILTVCREYGPYRKWLQCYYQARAKACPILTREISNGIPPSGALRTKAFGENRMEVKECEASDDEDEDDDWRAIPLRWDAEEPNILARMSVRDDPGGRDSSVHEPYKHHDLVFQSQVRDIEEPFLEPTIPYPLTVGAKDLVEDKYGAKINLEGIPTEGKVVDNDKKYYEQNLDSVSKAFLSEIEEVSKAEEPHARAHEAIVGPRGCDIGGWYEMMLYQARCIKEFRLNCMCDYDKTFVSGSAEAYVLFRSAPVFNYVEAYVNPGTDKKQGTADDSVGISDMQKAWPLMWRGTAGPDYAKNAPAAAHLVGLDNAKMGDFVIWDETIKDEDGNDARYRRHIAFVEQIREEEHWIEVSEWNWGKNQDSCGNTNRWKYKTTRRIHKTDTGNDGSPRGSCDDPDMRYCYEKNWERIKIYRQSEDLSGDNPVCDISTMPIRMSYESLQAKGVPSPKDSAAMSASEKVSSGAWKYKRIGVMSKDDVDSFVSQYAGKCDPPMSLREVAPKEKK